jgi:hypothetical protein
VRRVLERQSDAPAYFAEMKRVNKEGPRLLGAWHHPKRLTLDQFEARLAAGAVIVDTRPAAEYGAATWRRPRHSSSGSGSSSGHAAPGKSQSA